MLYVYRPNPSDGARLLEDTLNDIGVPARFTQGKLLRERFRPDRDKLICWGAYAEGREGINNVPPMTKYEEATKLREAGVATVEVSRVRPPAVPVGRAPFTFVEGEFIVGVDEYIAREEQVRAMMRRMQAYLDAPLPPPAEWLPRRNNHIGGSDLLRPGQADYFSKKENIVEEYRLHIFNGKSIRAGKKVPREGFFSPYEPAERQPAYHPWIRSFDAGWRIQYDGFTSTKEQRELAAKAVAALGLTFGAVDLGRTADGRLIVLEVNRAPGIEGGTVNAYAEKIAAYVRGE